MDRQIRRKKERARRKRRRQLQCMAAWAVIVMVLVLGIWLVKGAGEFLLAQADLVLAQLTGGGGEADGGADGEEQLPVKVSAEAIEELRAGGRYPESLLELLEKNEEAASFVLAYPEKKDENPPKDISGEVERGEIPLFIQWDERWGYEQYGGDFLAVTGCGPTCLSMVYSGLTGDTSYNPWEMACFAEQNGFYVEGTGTSWDLMTSGARMLGLNAGEVIFDEEHILRELEEGRPIICTMRPGDFTTTGHFIVLKSVDDNGEICVCDPNSPDNSSRTWPVDTLMPQIKNLWSYSAG